MDSVTFSGLSSGIDTASIVDQLMQVERVPINSLENRKSNYEFKKEIWREINTSILSLKDSVESLKKNIVDNYKKASVANEDYFSVSVNSDSAEEMTYDVEVIQLAEKMVVASDKITNGIGLSGVFSISDGSNTVDISVTSGESLGDLVSKINSETTLNIKASVIDERLVLTHNEEGVDNQISFVDTDGVLKSIGVLDASDALKNIVNEAQNAKVTINGLLVERGSNTMNDIIQDLTITLKKEGSSGFTVSNDDSKLITDINNFITAYNSTLDKINDRLTEEKPEKILSDFDRKKGLLKGDAQLNSIKNKLRESIYQNFGNEFEYLFNIGIETEDREGHLKLVDENKLKDAFHNNKQAFVNMFFEDVDGDEDMSEGDAGLLPFLNDYLNSLGSEKAGDEGVIPQVLESIDQTIERYDDKIERMEERLELKRDYYERQFLAMEKAMSTITSQGDYLIGSLTSMLSTASSNK